MKAMRATTSTLLIIYVEMEKMFFQGMRRNLISKRLNTLIQHTHIHTYICTGRGALNGRGFFFFLS